MLPYSSHFIWLENYEIFQFEEFFRGVQARAKGDSLPQKDKTALITCLDVTIYSSRSQSLDTCATENSIRLVEFGITYHHDWELSGCYFERCYSATAV